MPSRRTGQPILQRYAYSEEERQASGTSPCAAVRHPPGPPPSLIVLADFAPSASDLKPAHRELLTSLMRQEHLGTRANVVSIVGYTDAVGEDGVNASLRQSRAEAVRAFLVRAGFPTPALGSASGARAGTFLADNASTAHRAENRAVVIRLQAVAAPDPQVAGDGAPSAGAPRGLDAGLPPVTPRPASAAAVEVDVGDDHDVTGWVEGFVRSGEVYMTDVNSMVNNTLTAVGTAQISRLNIRAHASPRGMTIGTDWVDVRIFSTYSAALSRLYGRFSPGGFVHLQGCEIGQDQPLMRLFAATFGVRVYAGTGSQNNIYRINFGDYVVCHPDGTCRPPSRP